MASLGSSGVGQNETSDDEFDALYNAMEHLKRPDEDEKSFEEKLAVSYEPRHEKTCFCHMRTTKMQISLRFHTVWSAPLLFAT